MQITADRDGCCWDVTSHLGENGLRMANVVHIAYPTALQLISALQTIEEHLSSRPKALVPLLEGFPALSSGVDKLAMPF